MKTIQLSVMFAAFSTLGQVGVNYIGMIPILTKALEEQDHEIEILREKSNRMKIGWPGWNKRWVCQNRHVRLAYCQNRRLYKKSDVGINWFLNGRLPRELSVLNPKKT